MREVEFDRILDAVRKEIALVPVAGALRGLRATAERPRAADERRPGRRPAGNSMVRVRRLGEPQKRYR
jgi:hypothetical protein